MEKRIKRAVLQAGGAVRVGRIEFVVEENQGPRGDWLAEPVAGRSSAPIAPVQRSPLRCSSALEHPIRRSEYRCTKCRAVLCKVASSILAQRRQNSHIAFALHPIRGVDLALRLNCLGQTEITAPLHPEEHVRCGVGEIGERACGRGGNDGVGGVNQFTRLVEPWSSIRS